MHVVKIVSWWHLLKRHALMADPTVRRIIFPMDLASLLSDLVMMEIIDLAMMSLNLEMPIKRTWDMGGWNCSIEQAEC